MPAQSNKQFDRNKISVSQQLSIRLVDIENQVDAYAMQVEKELVEATKFYNYVRQFSEGNVGDNRERES